MRWTALILFVCASFAWANTNNESLRIVTLDNGAQMLLHDAPVKNPESTREHDPRNPLDQGGDDCANATVISSLPYCDTGSTVGYNDDYYELCLGVTGAPDVVYSFSPSADQNISISLTSSVYSTYLQIYETNTDCNSLSFYDCNNGVPTSCVEGIAVYSGYTYYVVVDGDWQESGDYILNVVEGYSCPSTPCSPPGNGGEDCSTAGIITSVPYCDAGTTAGHTDDIWEDCVGGTGSPDVVYTWVATADMDLAVSLCGSSYDTYLEIWETSTDCNDAYRVACNHNYCGLQSCQSLLNYYAGYTYYFIVDGENGESGDYIFHIGDHFVCPDTPCPTGGNTGENCANAIEIPSMDPVVTFTGNTTGMNNDYDFCGWSSAPDVVFHYTPTATHLGNVTSCNSTFFYSNIYIFRDGDLGSPYGGCGYRTCYSWDGNYYDNGALYCYEFEVGHDYCIVLDGDGPNDYGNYQITFESVGMETCSVDFLCAFPVTETEPNSTCFPQAFDADTLFLGDTIAGTICPAGDVDYFYVVTPEDVWNVIPVNAGPNCDQYFTDIGISYVFADGCWETYPCNNCGWISGCGPETVAVAIKGMGSCFTGTYKTFVFEIPRPIDECDPIACVEAPTIQCGVPTLVNTCDGCQTPICQAFRNGCTGDRAYAGLQKFFRLDVPATGNYTVDLVAADPLQDVQFSLFTDCVLPLTSCVFSQDQNWWLTQPTGPLNTETGTVNLTTGTYWLHVSREGGGNCGDMTLTVTCAAPCNAPDSLTVRWNPLTATADLSFIADGGTYEVYSTIIPNNDGNPTGGDPQWTLRATLPFAAGVATWSDPDGAPVYRNYAVVKVCQ